MKETCMIYEANYYKVRVQLQLLEMPTKNVTRENKIIKLPTKYGHIVQLPHAHIQLGILKWPTSTTKMTKLNKLQELKLDVIRLPYRYPAILSTNYANLLLIHKKWVKKSKY